MAVEHFLIGKYRVGYVVVRGRPLRISSNKSLPLEDPIHADYILPGGRLAGYAYDDNSFYNTTSFNQRKLKRLDGKISFEDEMEKHYWDIDQAMKYELLSTFVLFNVKAHHSEAFTDFWKIAREKAPNYNRVLNNCSTLCYEAFIKSGILEEGILKRLSNTIMTPFRLYQTLMEKNSKPEANLITRTGFFGIAPDNDNGGKKIVFVNIT